MLDCGVLHARIGQVASDGQAKRADGIFLDTGLRAIAAALLFPLACAAAGIFAPSRAEASPVVTWRLENPFRFFTDPHDTEAHRATYRSLGPSERQTPVLAEEHALQSQDKDGWAASMFQQDVLA